MRSSTARAHLSSAVVSALLAFLAFDCSVFDESMRHHADAGSNEAVADGGARPAPAPEARSCQVDAPAGVGAGTCGGPGGGLYAGAALTSANDATAHPLTREVAVCDDLTDGQVDRFELSVVAGDCFELLLQTTSVVMTVSGPGFSARSFSTGTQLPVQAPQAGAFSISVRANAASASYLLLVR